jgi:hypothetical protein
MPASDALEGDPPESRLSREGVAFEDAARTPDGILIDSVRSSESDTVVSVGGTL